MTGKPPHDGSLTDLNRRLRKAKQEQGARKGRSAVDESGSGLGMAYRVASELVAGLIVGVGIGYGLDAWLGTKPWFLIVFFFLGAAAGMWNVYKAVRGWGMSVGVRPAGGSTGNSDTLSESTDTVLDKEKGEGGGGQST